MRSGASYPAHAFGRPCRSRFKNACLRDRVVAGQRLQERPVPRSVHRPVRPHRGAEEASFRIAEVKTRSWSRFQRFPAVCRVVFQRVWSMHRAGAPGKRPAFTCVFETAGKNISVPVLPHPQFPPRAPLQHEQNNHQCREQYPL